MLQNADNNPIAKRTKRDKRYLFVIGVDRFSGSRWRLRGRNRDLVAKADI